MSKKNAAPLQRLVNHVSLALKSFDLTVVEWKSSTTIGHLQSLYKKKKYLFYICNHLTTKEAYLIKFKTAVEYCEKNNLNFIVAKSWDAELNKFAEKDNYAWKIIPMDKLTQLGRAYFEAKEAEKETNKAA